MPRQPDLSRRHELMTRAWSVLREAGLHAVSMRELADALGVKRPTLYFYFPDVASILEAVADDTLARQQRFLAERLVGRHHPIDFLYTWAATALKFHAASEADADTLRHLLSLARPGAADDALAGRISERLARFAAPIVALAVRSTRDGVARGQIAPCDPEALVGLLRAFIDGSLAQRSAHGQDPERALDALWTLTLAPLRVPAAAPGARPGQGSPVTAARARAGSDARA
jgi:AcrR family transcriptional regulator